MGMMETILKENFLEIKMRTEKSEIEKLEENTE
jgi:hypothetical protein